jgi:hypothetical protein
MKRSEAEPKIRALFPQWMAEHRPTVTSATDEDILLFYTWLRRNRTELLEFRFSGDHYQALKSILSGLYTHKMTPGAR